MPRTNRRGFYSVLLCLVIGHGISSVAAAAQSRTAAQSDKLGIESVNDNFKFEVVSIRPVKTPKQSLGLTPDGLDIVGNLWTIMMAAYAADEFPAYLSLNPATRISNLPTWSGNLYEINARVADSDREAWRNQGSRQDLLSSALRNVLKERFKLVIHQQPNEVYGLRLVRVGKDVKLKSTPKEFVPPSGRQLRSGGVAVPIGRSGWHYYGATMQDLALFLSLTARRPVQDRTGLTGRYEFSIQSISHPSQDPETALDNWPIEQLGLDLKPGNVPGRMLIIDHIEQPSEN